MPIKRGDIVLADLPFSNMSGSKVWPALVVQCDFNNSRLDDVIVAVVTRTTTRVVAEPTQILVDITTADGKKSTLLHTSAVKCEHLVTIEQNLIRKTIGQLTTALMAQIDACLKVSLELK